MTILFQDERYRSDASKSLDCYVMTRSGQLSILFVLGTILGEAAPANPADAEFARLLHAGTEEGARGDFVHASADLEAAVALEPQNAEGWFQLGLVYNRTASFRNAELAFRKAVELDPHDAQAHFWLGWTLVVDPQSKQDWAGAIAESRAALADEPDDADALNLLGTGLTNLGELAKAVEVLKRATAIKPSSAAAHYNLAVALEKSGQAEEATKEYAAAIAAKSDYIEARTALGKLLLGMGKPADAEQELLTALSVNPDFADAHYALARTMQAFKKTSDAKIEFEEAADLAGRQSEGIQSMHLSNESLALASHGDFGGATKTLRDAVALKPDYGVPHYNLGLILADTGDMTGAIRELHVAISLLPGQAKPWFDLGRVFERQGDSKRAFEAFSWAARLAPNDPAMQAKLKSVEPPQGILAPDSLNITNDTAADHLAAGEELLRERQSIDAVSELLRALVLAPANVEARRKLAATYESQGDFGKAILEFHKLLLVSPHDTPARLALEKLQAGADHGVSAPGKTAPQPE
jgi:tetratricopeptide (TPR) repeat protein